MHRVALLLACALTLAPAWIGSVGPPVRAGRGCAPEGRGRPPRHWIGCAADPGPPRALQGAERILAGLQVDVNAATAEDLAAVPGIGPRLAREVVAERERAGAFVSLDALLRVRGIGPARLARARRHLALGP